ncbi:MAG TPA: DUF2064 domain-containing protein [Gemmatimonadaceae bacterium]
MQATSNEDTSGKISERERAQRRAIEHLELSDRSAGARVTEVVRDRLADGSQRIVITNSDREVPRELVDHAFEALRYSGLVCAADANGEIALLGMSQPLDELFAMIPFGSVGALEGLLTAAREHHVSVMLLPPARSRAP